MPFFSVITVVWNDFAGFKGTTQSLHIQSFRDFEWIVVDGASKDGTMEFVKELQLPFLRWVSERDAGIFDAMNKGTNMATAQYLVFMNAGDTFVTARDLEYVRKTIVDAGFPELCYAGGNYRFADGTTRYRGPRKMETAIRHGLPAMHQSTYYRRDFLPKPAYQLCYPVSADYQLSADLYMSGANACYLHKPTSNYGLGGNSTKKAGASLVEAWQIQRDILQLNVVARLLSACRRYLTHRLLFSWDRFRGT